MPRAASAAATCASSGPWPRTSTRRPSCSTLSTPGQAFSHSKLPSSVNRTVLVPANFEMSPAAVSTAATLPRRNTAMRSHRSSASSMKCVTSTTVVPRRRTSRTRSQAARRAAGSSPVVISSRNTISGSFTSASAMNSRCRWPPERSPKALLRFCVRSHSSRSPRQSRERGESAAKRSSASQTRRRSGSDDSWSWLPMRCRNVVPWICGSSPRTATSPPSRLRSPCRHSTVVVLPDPLAPMIPKISPGWTSNETPLTAWTCPYRFCSPRTKTADSPTAHHPTQCRVHDSEGRVCVGGIYVTYHT